VTASPTCNLLAGGPGASLSWTESTPGRVAQYAVYISTNDSTFSYVTSVSSSTTSYSESGLEPGKTYEFEVEAVSPTNLTTSSNPASVTTSGLCII
jgi:hypothetical protein